MASVKKIMERLVHFGLLVVLLPILEIAKAASTVQSTKPTEVQLVGILAHNTSAFTEGLFILNGSLWESTGLHSRSFIREYDLPTPRRSINTTARRETMPTILRQFEYPTDVFGEGIASINGHIYALTYKKREVLVIDQKNLSLMATYPFDTTTGEGWGMTTDGELLIVSDGSSTIQFHDPKQSFKVVRSIQVRHKGKAVEKVNELEYVHGEILANVWFKNELLRIDPGSGGVIEVIDLNWLPDLVTNLPTLTFKRSNAVMNGIAYNDLNQHVYLTGKLWNALFEFDLSCYKHS